MTEGSSLMNRINSGDMRKVRTDHVAKATKAITTACEEILEVGARIRPLMDGSTQVGWVRGVHLTERKLLKRWISDPADRLAYIARYGSTLTQEQVEQLSPIGMRSLQRLIGEMTMSDIRLFPFLSAYSTTSSSERLWFSKGAALSSFERRSVPLPDGSEMLIHASSDHARLWSTLCSYRERNKTRVDESLNAVLIIRPWVGRSADSLANDLRQAAAALHPDVPEPWTETVTMPEERNLEDGWAHGEDDSPEGIRRELHNMLAGDRHEQVMDAWDRQQRAEAQKKSEDLAARVQARREAAANGSGFTREVFTEAQMVERQQKLNTGRPPGLSLTDPDTK